MKKHYEKQMADPDPYNRAFVGITGIGRYDMSYISKESIYNQFRSDLVTPLPKQIDNGETEVHVFYAKKMGEKYLDRYKKYYKNPIRIKKHISRIILSTATIRILHETNSSRIRQQKMGWCI